MSTSLTRCTSLSVQITNFHCEHLACIASTIGRDKNKCNTDAAEMTMKYASAYSRQHSIFSSCVVLPVYYTLPNPVTDTWKEIKIKFVQIDCFRTHQNPCSSSAHHPTRNMMQSVRKYHSPFLFLSLPLNTDRHQGQKEEPAWTLRANI